MLHTRRVSDSKNLRVMQVSFGFLSNIEAVVYYCVVVKHADSQHRGFQFNASMCHF